MRITPDPETAHEGYEIRTCGHSDCDYQFVGSDDTKMFAHMVEEHDDWLKECWWNALAEGTESVL